MIPLSIQDAESRLARLPAWCIQGDELVRTFEFKDFAAAIQFVNRVADLAEKSCHHPDIDIRYSRVRLALTTHDASGLTEKDFSLAEQIDLLLSPAAHLFSNP